jgi:hypothetical protein
MKKIVVKILIIGAGQIGSRHLQGALTNRNELSITVVDPSPSALKLSRERAKEIKFGNPKTTVAYTKKIPKNKTFEVCIVSTNADKRAKVTIDLLASCNLSYLVFEKVVFQKKKDFEIISKILKKKDVNAWVNCPRRMFNIYKEIRKKIDLNLPVNMEVTGSSWGMTCNAIHFIDLFSYFINDSNFIITEKNFSKNIFESKRGKNFYEISGSMKGINGKHSILISCEESKKNSLYIKIKNGNIENTVDENKKIWIKNTNGLIKSKKINIPYQSDITGKLIDNLINKRCRLVSYENSSKNHIPLLKTIKSHLSKILKRKLNECPIT